MDYYDPVEGKTKSVNAEVVTSSTDTFADGWYVVKGDVSRAGIAVTGAANLILADGTTLTVNGDSSRDAGIRVASGSSLSIYGQAAGTGVLTVAGGPTTATAQ